MSRRLQSMSGCCDLKVRPAILTGFLRQSEAGCLVQLKAMGIFKREGMHEGWPPIRHGNAGRFPCVHDGNTTEVDDRDLNPRVHHPA